MNLSIDIKKAAKEIEAENANFDYQAGPLEVANQVWFMLTVEDRFNFSQAVQKAGGKIKGIKGLRSSVKLLAKMIEQ